jgi:hypothetical protein
MEIKEMIGRVESTDCPRKANATAYDIARF